jgi:hypothetical protein
MAWTRITDQDEAATLLPSWLGRRFVGLHGRFGLLLTTGDVLRITSIGAVLLSSDGTILLDVALDHAGVPDGVDLAWRTKHFLGVPYPGSDEATVNLAHVVMAVEFAEIAVRERDENESVPSADEVIAELERLTEETDGQSDVRPALERES